MFYTHPMPKILYAEFLWDQNIYDNLKVIEKMLNEVVSSLTEQVIGHVGTTWSAM